MLLSRRALLASALVAAASAVRERKVPVTVIRKKNRPGVVPGTIDATGTTDVAASLTAWLDSLPSDSIADLAGGTFRVESKVRLNNKVGLTIRNGTLIRKGPTRASPTLNFPEPLLWLHTPTNCHVTGMHFEDTNIGEDTAQGGGAGFPAYIVNLELDAAVRLEAFTGCSMTSCTANHIYGDGVQWQTGSGGTTTDCSFDRIGRQGVTLIGSNLLCDNTDVLHGRRSGYDIEPDSADQVVSNIEIRNAVTNTIGLPIASGGRGAIDSVYIHHNNWSGASVPCVYIKDSTPTGAIRRSNWRIEDNFHNNELGSPQSAVYAHAVDNLSVKRNTISIVSSQSRGTVWLDKCGGLCEITDNAWGSGIYYKNDLPEPGQTLNVSGNTPSLSLAP